MIDRELDEHIKKQDSYAEVQMSIKHLSELIKLESRIQRSRKQRSMYIDLATSNMVLTNLVSLKVGERDQRIHDQQTDMHLRFQRVIRRLMILRAFAKKLG